MNRAACKMAAMDAAFGGIFSYADAPDAWRAATEAAAAEAEGNSSVRVAPGMLYFGDVAAGPGGFSEYLLWRRGASAKGFGFTLRGAQPVGAGWDPVAAGWDPQGRDGIPPTPYPIHPQIPSTPRSNPPPNPTHPRTTPMYAVRKKK